MILIALFAIGCGTQPTASSTVIPEAPEGSGVVNVANDDPEMDAAMKKANSTLAFFETSWNENRHDVYSIKFALPTSSGDLEHIWFSPTSIEGDSFTGTCANDPLDIPNLKMGDVRTVDRAEVSDWMMLVGRKCFGGYTIRVLAERDPNAAPPLEFVDHDK